MNIDAFERVVTPYTLLNCDGSIVRFRLDTEAKITKARMGGGIILEDWETAEKVAFGLTPEKGDTLNRPKTFPQPLFIPHNLPGWACVVEPKKQ
jgi:hypothetical protein